MTVNTEITTRYGNNDCNIEILGDIYKNNKVKFKHLNTENNAFK